MYRVNYDTLLEILEKAHCTNAIAEIKKHESLQQIVTAIEIDFAISDKDTEHESWTVIFFNIYTHNDTVLFSVMFRHKNDFTLESTRTKPFPHFKQLGPELIEQTSADKLEENLDFLQTRALDACEYADTQDERVEGYTEVDKAYAIVATTLKKKSDQVNIARSKLSDLSRVIEKLCGDSDGEDEIDRRINELYAILKGAE